MRNIHMFINIYNSELRNQISYILATLGILLNFSQALNLYYASLSIRIFLLISCFLFFFFNHNLKSLLFFFFFKL